MSERILAVVKKYLGLIISFAATVALLAVFMWWWPQTGYPMGSGTDVVSAFGTVLVALSALFIGQGLRQRQEEAAHARAQLALNVELITRVIAHQSHRILEVEVRVKNISSKGWNLPMAYVFVHPVDVSQKVAGASPIWAPEIRKLRGVNVARFANTMTRLCPDEEEVFSKAYLIDEGEAQEAPYLLVLVEAIGAPDSHGFGKAERKAFDVFMNGGLKEDVPDPALKDLPDAAQAAQRIRDTYMVIETTERDLCDKGYPKRVLILPPGKSNELKSGQEARIDITHTKLFRIMLDDTMMWSRSRVVCVGDVQRGGVEAADANAA